ncbi:MAG: glycosyltransferase family protein [Gammaproteobacteria bacterium]|nr:MAG: glycosyltransferase family protein [Gammaproteobacteria bacterium]
MPGKPEPARLYQAGLAHHQAGRLAEAEAAYRQVLAHFPRQPDALHMLGVLAHQAGRHEVAVELIGKAIRIAPKQAAFHNNLGSCHEARGDLAAALVAFRRAIALQPGLPEAHNNVGNVLQALGDAAGAIAAYRQALALRPDYADAHDNLGAALQAAGRPDEAIEAHQRALALRPDHAGAQWNLAYALLLKGDFAAGWKQNEWRWRVSGRQAAEPGWSQPLWLGTPTLAGRTILVHHEQGLGDTLQMLRYVPLLAAQGARVLLRMPATLAGLAATVPGVAAVLEEGAPLPHFDLHCPCMSLPLAFGTLLETIPATVPYLHAPEAARQAWQARLGPARRRRIGLAWAGSSAHRNDRNRSLPFARLAPLLGCDAEFHSLQKEYRPGDVAALRADGRLVDHAAALDTLADTAGLIAALDLVITVDTAIAHLAGAMGRPVWLLLPHAPDYRWLLDRDDSPWYPGMRLFRQPVAGDWASVVERVKRASADGIGSGQG